MTMLRAATTITMIMRVGRAALGDSVVPARIATGILDRSEHNRHFECITNYVSILLLLDIHLLKFRRRRQMQ